MKLLTILLTLFLCACPQQRDTRVNNPSPSSIAGKWESINVGGLLSYALLDMDKNGQGVLVASGEHETAEVFTLSDFVSQEKSFLITAYIIRKDVKREKFEQFEGFLDQGKLCFSVPAHDENMPPVCFLKYKQLDEYRHQADQILNK